jgi:hypothetical protein
MTTARVKHYAMLIGGDDIDSPQHMTIINRATSLLLPRWPGATPPISTPR